MKTNHTMVLAFASVAMLATTLEVQAVGNTDGLKVVEVMMHGNEMSPAAARGIPLIKFSEVLPECGDDIVWVPSGSAQSEVISIALSALIHRRIVDVAYDEAVNAPWGPFHCRLERLDIHNVRR